VTCTPDRHRINAHAEREIPGLNVTTEEAGQSRDGWRPLDLRAVRGDTRGSVSVTAGSRLRGGRCPGSWAGHLDRRV